MKIKFGRQSRGLAILAGLLGLLVILDLAGPAGRAGLPYEIIARPLAAFYRAGPSRLMIHHCPSFPSCPDYALQAAARHGLILGAFLTADRLIHEGGRLREGPLAVVEGRLKLYDPLAANTFWWSGSK